LPTDRSATLPGEFDMQRFFAAIDAKRGAQGLSWQGLATAIWDQSHVLNARRGGHPISPETIRKLSRQPQLTCQHAIAVLRWLELPPEAFIAAQRRHGGHAAA
jgi:hypothetical protein